jgi:hypothetical protein
MVTAYFKGLFQHLFGVTEENCENISQSYWSLGQDLNRGDPKYESEVMTMAFSI